MLLVVMEVMVLLVPVPVVVEVLLPLPRQPRGVIGLYRLQFFYTPPQAPYLKVAPAAAAVVVD